MGHPPKVWFIVTFLTSMIFIIVTRTSDTIIIYDANIMAPSDSLSMTEGVILS